MFKSRKTYVVPHIPEESVEDCYPDTLQETPERRKWTHSRSASSNTDQMSDVFSPSPRHFHRSNSLSPFPLQQYSTSPTLKKFPPSATSTTSKLSWETATVPLRNQRSMKIKYYKGPQPKLKSSSSAIKIYRENSDVDGRPVKPLMLHHGVQNLSFETEEEEEEENEEDFDVEDFDVDGFSESEKTCSCHLENGLKRSKPRGKEYFLANMEMIFKVTITVVCFIVPVGVAITMLVVLLYYLEK